MSYNPFFEVIRNPLYTEYKGESVRVPKDALLSEEGDVLGVVGSNYKLIHNQEVFETINDSLSDIEIYSSKDHLNGKGNKWCRSLILNDSEFCKNIAGTDHVKTKIDIFNSYSGLDAAGFNLSAWRLVCDNGMMGWRNIASFKFHHIHENLSDKIRDSFEKMFDKFKDNFEIWEVWSREEMDQEAFNSFIERHVKTDKNSNGFLSEKQATGIKDLYPEIKRKYGEEDTKWGAYNVLTAIATHHVQARKGSPIFSQGYTRLSRLVDSFYKEHFPSSLPALEG